MGIQIEVKSTKRTKVAKSTSAEVVVARQHPRLSFLGLPAEIRNEIYQYCFADVSCMSSDYGWLLTPGSRWRSIMAVSREIRYEALPILYGGIVVELSMANNMLRTEARQWLQLFETSAVPQSRHLSIGMGPIACGIALRADLDSKLFAGIMWRQSESSTKHSGADFQLAVKAHMAEGHLKSAEETRIAERLATMVEETFKAQDIPRFSAELIEKIVILLNQLTGQSTRGFSTQKRARQLGLGKRRVRA